MMQHIPRDAELAHLSVVSFLTRQFRLASPSPTFPREHAVFAMALIHAGSNRFAEILAAALPAATVEIAWSQPLPGQTPNLYVKATHDHGSLRFGLKIALSDVALRDWEQPGFGLREVFVPVMVAVPTAPVVDHLQDVVVAVSRQITPVLENGADRPLLYRAEVGAAQYNNAGDQAAMAAALAELRQAYPELATRAQHYTNGSVPSAAEANARFQSMPWERSKL